MFKQIR